MSQDPQHKTECEIVPFLQTQLVQQVYCNRRVSSPGAFYSGSQIEVSDLVHIVVLSGDVNKHKQMFLLLLLPDYPFECLRINSTRIDQRVIIG